MLSERLIELRKKSGLTQADISKHLKITRQAYSFYESNQREMDFASLISIAKFYNVTTDYLLCRGDVETTAFSNEEIEIVSKYRALDGRGKNAVKATLEFELSYVTKNDDAKKSVM